MMTSASDKKQLPQAADRPVPPEILSALTSSGILSETLDSGQRALVLKAVALSISLSHVEHHHGDGLPALVAAIAESNPALADEIVRETLEDTRFERSIRLRDQDEDCRDREEERVLGRKLATLRERTTYFTWGFALIGTALSFGGFLATGNSFWLLGTAFVIGGPVAVTALARNTRIIVGKVEDDA